MQCSVMEGAKEGFTGSFLPFVLSYACPAPPSKSLSVFGVCVFCISAWQCILCVAGCSKMTRQV